MIRFDLSQTLLMDGLESSRTRVRDSSEEAVLIGQVKYNSSR